MRVHVTMPNPYKVQGCGISDFNEDSIQVGKVYRVISDRGNVLERQVTGINQPYKGRVQLLRLNEQDTIHVSIDVFIKVMRGRGIQD